MKKNFKQIIGAILLTIFLLTGITSPIWSATQPQRTLRVIGGYYYTDSAPEAANQSFVAGQLVYLVNGLMTACADDATLIAGVALQPASAVTNTVLRYIRITPTTILCGSVYHSTPASAVTARAQVGNAYSLQVDSNKCYPDIEDSGNTVFQVVGIESDYRPREEAVGDKWGRLRVKVKYDHIQ